LSAIGNLFGCAAFSHEAPARVFAGFYMTANLTGRRILLVEDQYLLASELSAALEQSGAIVLGPANDLNSARAVAAEQPPEAAILDVKLATELVYPLADELAKRDIPFLFATGFDCDVLPDRFRGAPCYEKPVNVREIVSALGRLVQTAPAL
jgi:DNA-binding response OmpR family regulator